MKAKDLKNSILQMAVEGKLAPQDPSDEPASVLLERIRAEKHKLIAEGKAKFPKGGESVIYIGSDGSPYEKRVDAKGRVLSDECIADKVPLEKLPEGWAWARIGAITELVNGKAFKPSDWTPSGIPIVRIQNLNNPDSPYNRYDGDCDSKFLLYGGELLFAWSGTPGTSFGAHVWNGGKALLNQHIFNVKFSKLNLDINYLKLSINQSVLSLIDLAHGSAGLQHVTRGTFESTLIPIPPLAEQHKIVERIDELMPLVEEYGKLEDAREELDAALPGRLHKSVLQMAVQGKLVPQNPVDEPASALLERIREQHRKLIAEKKMKPPKGGESVIYAGSDGRRYEKRVDAKGRESELVCIEDEIPFEIPDSWEWARLDSICDLVRGSGIKRSDIVDEGLPCVRYGELYTTYETSIDTVASHTSEAVFDVSKKLGAGEVLITLTGENNIDIGRAVFNATGETLAFGGDLLALKGQNVRGDYLAMAINSSVVGSQRTRASTGNIIVHLSATKACRFLIPIPPLDEQRRIVERINEFVTLITNQ